MRGHRAVRGRDADAQDPVVRTTEREHRAREAGGDLRRDDDERRAPGQTAALTEEDRLGRIRRIGTEAREDLEGARERMRTTPERRARSLVREVVQAVGHEADLASGVRGDAHHVRRGRHDELDRFGIGLDPVLLVRSNVDEEHRVEASRGLVQLRLELAQPRRGLPVDLFTRIAAPVLAHAAKAQRIGQ